MTRLERLVVRLRALSSPLLALGVFAGVAHVAVAQTVETPIGPQSAVSSSPPQGLTGGSGLPAPVIAGGFDGLARSNGVPPDPNGAAGIKGFIQVTNRQIRYFPKLFTAGWVAVDLGSFFPGTNGTGSLFDPKVDYDAGTGRFYVVALEQGGSPTSSFLNIAVSKDDDPSSANGTEWYFYRLNVTDIQGGTRYGIDYPGLGHDHQALYVTGNFYVMPFTTNSAFHRAKIFAFNKASLNSGTLTYTISMTPTGSTSGSTLQPASVLGTTTPGNVAYFADIVLSLFPFEQNRVRVWALSNPVGTPTLTSSTLVTIDHGGQPTTDAPQLGTTQRVAVRRLGIRAQGNAFWHNGALWFCHTAGGSSSDGRSIVYYYKVLTNGFPSGSPTVATAGGIDGGPGVWNFQPALGGNAYGDVCVVYSQSSATTYPRIMAVARNVAASEFSSPIVLKTSPTFYLNGSTSDPRWGDYASVSADPADNRFWTCAEYSRGSATTDDWGSWWTKIVVPEASWRAEGTSLKVRGSSDVGTTFFTRVLSDGASGAYVVWPNASYDASPGIRLSRVSGGGALVAGWPIDGIQVASGYAYYPHLAADLAGGVFVAWQSGSSVYLQRMTSAGAVASGWPVNGVLIGDGYGPVFLTPDATGGVFMSWYHTGGTGRLQRISSSGAIATGWPAGGLQLGGSTPNQQPYYPVAVADQFGGAIVSVANGANTIVKRITGAGVPHSAWPIGGVTITGFNAQLSTDQSGGAYLAYLKTVGSEWDLYATRITGAGTFAAGWSAAGIVVSNAAGNQAGPQLVPDGAGGVLIAWITGDPTYGGTYHALRLRGNGAPFYGWPANGVLLSNDPMYPYQRTEMRLSSDGMGGGVLVWEELRNFVGCTGPVVGCDWDIYGSRISGGGVIDPSMPLGGKAISALLGVQQFPDVVLSSPGRVITAWEDTRSFPAECQYCGYEVYAQEVNYDGVAPGSPMNFSAANGRTTMAVSWEHPGDDGQTGNAVEFQLRYTAGTFTDDNFFTTGTVIANGPSPAQGTPQCVSLSNLTSCVPYQFGFKARDDAGNWAPATIITKSTRCSGSIQVMCADGLTLERDPAEQLPTRVALDVHGELPARGPVAFGVQIPARSSNHEVELSLFDVTGRRVRNLVNSRGTPGQMEVSWDLRDTRSNRVKPGVYFARLRVGPETEQRTVVVVD